jgi:carbon-monoxide dehydrogenase small subunit
MRVQLRVNGAVQELEANPNRTVLSLLREDLRLTGTKQGCAVGVCGLCSILVDGQLTSACLLLAPMVDGRAVTTIEGIGSAGGQNGLNGLSWLQRAFIDHAGFQCGICTPGQIVAATALLQETPAPTKAEIRHWMMGNLCRCTGYHGIVESIQAAASGVVTSPADDERLDGPAKVSGSANYAADLSRPGLLRARALRSP